MRMRDLRRPNPINHVDELTHPAKCPECGKRFEIRFADDYVFQRKRKNGTAQYWCSWHCWRAMKNKEEEPLKGENYIRAREEQKRKSTFKPPIGQDVKDKVVDLYKEGGKTLTQIADEAGCSAWFVARYLEKLGLYKKTRRCSAWHRG